MREQLESSQAIARTVARCRPEVVSAYPITPQTHIVEGIARLVRTGELAPCEFVNVESEFAACSVAIGASAAGARTYTATASQGLLYMAEALFNASGLGLPIVMTVANRAIGAPINIWNDHSDAMAMRDCGWIQLFASDNQEAIDLHVQAYRIAEELSLPVMVCMDGFVLTHAFEPLEIPAQDEVDAFLPAFEPRQVLDPEEPMTIGAMVGPEAFTEVRYLAHARQLQALDLIPQLAAEFGERFGRRSGGLLEERHSADAETVVVALGSVLGTLEAVVEELRGQGASVGVVALKSFRPFPAEELAAALRGARRVVVLERTLAAGVGGIVSADVLMALARDARDRPLPSVHTVVAGLGGRAITCKALRAMLTRAAEGGLADLELLELRTDIVERELQPAPRGHRPGPHAESILRELRLVGAGPV